MIWPSKELAVTEKASIISEDGSHHGLPRRTRRVRAAVFTARPAIFPIEPHYRQVRASLRHQV